MRADLYLVTAGYAVSRARAARMIEEGTVRIDGKPIAKPSQEISEGDHTVEATDTLRFVGRGGLKLEAAMDAFPVNASGVTALDVGASTGGFTDCLLQRGAKKVFAVDAGEGQLAESLRADPRVVSMERTNARDLTEETLGCRVDLVVMDVSFISATCILPIFPHLMKERADAVCLIKPQFEVGRAWIGKGGIVKDPAAHRYAIERVWDAGVASGLVPMGLIPSPIMGGDGNLEFLIWFRKGEDASRGCGRERIRTAAAEAASQKKNHGRK